MRPDSKTCTDLLRRSGRITLLFLVAPVLAGCYRYVPTDVESVHPGMEVRADVSADAARRLEPLLDSHARTIDGSVAYVQSDGLMLLVPVAVRRQASGVQLIRRRISLLSQDITRLQRRSLDRTRTAALVGVGVLALGAVVYAATSGGTAPARHATPLATRVPGFGLHLVLPLSWAAPYLSGTPR